MTKTMPTPSGVPRIWALGDYQIFRKKQIAVFRSRKPSQSRFTLSKNEFELSLRPTCPTDSGSNYDTEKITQHLPPRQKFLGDFKSGSETGLMG